MSKATERYDALYPEVGIGDAQKQERGERLAFKEDRALHRRTTRTKGVVVPSLPWKKEEA